MYSGTTFNRKSGHLIGVHQRIDRVARRNIDRLAPSAGFPDIKGILHFEGNNGPDGVKRKSPSRDEPWHFIDPADPKDTQLIDMILDHQHNLTVALAAKDEVRAAFEASWLAHAITDGLTPAHHYPLDEKIEELWGKPRDERFTLKEKSLIIGETNRETISKNWEYWGAKGVFSTHYLFEWGVALAIRGHRFRSGTPSKNDIQKLESDGLEGVLRESIDYVYKLNMYENFWKNGWSTSLALETRHNLMPEIIRTVTLAWLSALPKDQL